MELTKNQKQRISDLCEKNPVARAICASFRERTRGWSYHSAERLLQFTHQYWPEDTEPPAYGDVLEVLKAFQDIGLGVYKQGRKGKKTRIEWAEGVHIIDIGLAGRDLVEELDDEFSDAGFGRAPEPTTVKKLVKHQYKLRPDLELALHVPQDLSPVEARRLAAFIGSLSME